MRYQRPLVPENFAVPAVLETARVRLRQLTIADLDLDYEAVMSSADHLRAKLGPGNQWPVGLTREHDLADLGWHETEFNNRASFCYTVVSLDESVCLGCVYIYPSLAAGYDAKCFLWVRASAVDEGLDEHLFDTVRDWLAEAWPFGAVAFPGRTTDWADFKTAINAGTAIDRAGFERWLEAYKAAWQEQDPDAAAALFTEDATYREMPFSEPFRGRAAIRAYWAEVACESQRDIDFDYQVWAVDGDTGVCHWSCRLTRRASGERVELDGAFRCVFSSDDDEAGLCRVFEEWWHRREVSSA